MRFESASVINVYHQPVICFFSLLILITFYGTPVSENHKAIGGGEQISCEVLGVHNKLSDKNWKDERIGLGVQALLTEALYQCGMFKFVETNDRIQKKREEIATGMWHGKYKKKDFSLLIEKSENEVLAWATLLYFGRPQSELSIGIVHRNTDAAVIRIEITLLQKSTGKKWKATGEGKSTTTASSVLFTYQDDKVKLDETNIGNALKKAITDAVDNIVKEIQI
ncbi:MAG: hypothetical protein JW915_20995 [Chitinispirillaceae bacterium]|nr:hypothetical protein [Chitinispirillaceae bacterium]